MSTVAQGMYGIQEWSAGDIFPAVIMRVETYAEFPSFDEWLCAQPRLLRDKPLYRLQRARHYEMDSGVRLFSTEFVLLMNGEEATFDTYDGALECVIDNMVAQS